MKFSRLPAVTHTEEVSNRIVHSRRVVAAPVFVEYDQTFRQSFRVAEDALDRYELWIGEDAEPDLTAAPDDTSATLPFDTAFTPPGVGTKVLHTVTKKRNKYGLYSFNRWTNLIEVDTNGDEVLGELTAPVDVQLFSTDTTGEILVWATYNGADRNKPDLFEVYATDGADPNPAIDTPAYSGDAIFITEIAVLQARITGYTPGNTIHVIAGVKRSADSEKATAAVVEITLPVAPDIGSYGSGLFGGSVYEER